ncbi:MAG: glycosyltransferase, partial [Thermocladium sp.]
LGRFSEEKRYHWVVKEVAPRLFKEMPNAELIIMGGATTRTQINYLDRVEAEARKVGLRVIRGTDAAKKDGGIVRLIPNAPRSMINSIMDSSRAFLHATINEHWGIAVAEAMSRGLPIVVHASGGTWTDLAGEGENGIGYRDPEGAVEALAKLLTNEPTFSKFSISALSRVKGLTLKEYSDKLGKIVRELL